MCLTFILNIVFFFQAEDGIRDYKVLEFRRVLFRSGGVLSVQPGADPRSLLVNLASPPESGKTYQLKVRSEERRVGKESRARWSTDPNRKKGRAYMKDECRGEEYDDEET